MGRKWKRGGDVAKQGAVNEKRDRWPLPASQRLRLKAQGADRGTESNYPLGNERRENTRMTVAHFVYGQPGIKPNLLIRLPSVLINYIIYFIIHCKSYNYVGLTTVKAENAVCRIRQV